jgi:hypothetical protein
VLLPIQGHDLAGALMPHPTPSCKHAESLPAVLPSRFDTVSEICLLVVIAVTHSHDMMPATLVPCRRLSVSSIVPSPARSSQYATLQVLAGTPGAVQGPKSVRVYSNPANKA